MKQIKNKILSVILSVVIALTPCAVALLTKAQEKTINVNTELLDSLLRDRSWIIESIVSVIFKTIHMLSLIQVPPQSAFCTRYWGNYKIMLHLKRL